MANTYLDFVKDPDQATRRAELAAFCGARPEKFLKIYDNMAAIANRPAGTKPAFKMFDGGFCWPAFFLGPIWMFYRKMWVYAGIVIAISVLFTLLPIPHGASIGLGVAIAIAGARLYVTNAITTITRLRSDPARLAAASSVSLPAAIVAGVVYFALFLFLAIHTFHSTQTLGGPTGTYSSSPR